MAERGGPGGAVASVRVRAPARLHLGLIDLSGSLGRRFGSIGLAVDAPAFDMTMRPSATLTATGPEATRVLRYVHEAAAALGLPALADITIREAIPAHAGFGSGTQVALAVAAGLGRLNRLAVDIGAAAGRLARGARSGIGVGAFLTGGFLVDGGRGPDDAVPPIIARLPFPEDWRLVLIEDAASTGVHGRAEAAAFQSLPPMDDGEVAHLCRLVMVRLLPGLATADIGAAGAALTEIQARLGDYFAPAQGGNRFASPAVSTVLDAAMAAGAAGVGQSSWGPTGFALTASAAEASALVDRIGRDGHAGLRVRIVRGRNQGAVIETTTF